MMTQYNVSIAVHLKTVVELEKACIIGNPYLRIIIMY